MDRVISLLAALVGLIALGGAVLVASRADTQQQAMAGQIAQLQSALGQAGGAPVLAPAAAVPAASASAVAPAEGDGTAEALLALQDRIAALEQTTRDQAGALQAAQTALASQASIAPLTPAATADAQAAPSAEASGMPAAETVAAPSAVTADGPTTDCIPLGTRFIGASGDSFPICKTKVVVAVASVSDGIATIRGAGDVPVGATTDISQGCSVSLFSADLASGYAEMRVACR